jgi:hypothetical protein
VKISSNKNNNDENNEKNKEKINKKKIDHKLNPVNPWKAKIEWLDPKNEILFINDYKK